ncbi:ATP-grasp domain-containing protein [Streptomyces sp. NRAIS4]
MLHSLEATSNEWLTHMRSVRHEKPRLLFFDVTSGPKPERYLPSLCSEYELHIMWIASGNSEKDAKRAAKFEQWCTHSVMRSFETAPLELAEFGEKWRPLGILGLGEQAMTAIHEAALRLGLPANEPECIPALRNKYQQRILLNKADVPIPRFAPVKNARDLQAAVRHVGTPAVLKPVAGVGSMATYKLNGGENLEEVWEEAVKFYTTDPRGEAVPNFLVEEMLVGAQHHADPRYAPYASVESFVENGRITHLAVTDKLPLTKDFRENGGIMPSVLPPEVTDALMDCASRAITAMGITNSGVHTEIMLTAAGPRVIEVNSRIGGGVTEMLQQCSGYDSILARAAVATGMPLPEYKSPSCSTAYYSIQAPAFDTELKSQPTYSELLEIPEIVEAELQYATGAHPEWRRGTPGGMVLRAIGVAESASRLLDLYEQFSPGQLFQYISR